MDLEIVKLIIKNQAEDWLKENPLLLNGFEKQKFLMSLQNYLDDKNFIIDDEVYDFLVQKKLINNEPREEGFVKYLTKKYKSLKGVKILDVGAGRVCSLSKAIVKHGGRVTATDKNIRLDNQALKRSKIHAEKGFFVCDEYSQNGQGTNIDRFDLIVGLEPCDATEHIIRQSLKYDKPFDVSLCAAPHKSLDGKCFRTYEEWYNHLSNISNEVTITKIGSDYIATNNKGLEL